MKKNRLIFALLSCALAIFIVSCTAGHVDEGYIEPAENWDDDKGNAGDVILKLNESGFDVYILEDITTNKKLGIPAFTQLKKDLATLNGILPASIMTDLKRHPIHVINVVGSDPIYYDNDPGSEYAGSIVINDIGVWYNQVTRNQPMLLLRILAEVYYDKYMPADKKSAIESAYAARGTKYASVYQSNGIKLQYPLVESPAATDALNYFLELSEAYFDGNDYYPFDYAELDRYDPTGLAAVAAVWGTRTIGANPYGVMLPPDDLRVGSGSYKKALDVWHRKCIFADCNGYSYPIVGSRFVADSCFAQAKAILEKMSIDKTGTDFMKLAMESNKENGYYIVIAAKGESFSDTPEFRGNTSMNGAYGYGSTPGSPSLIIVESDICGPGIGGVKLGQSLLCHEFGHNIEDGIGRKVAGFTNTLTEMYTRNITNGEMWTGAYAASSYREYWAEATTAWYNAGSKGMQLTVKTGDIIGGVAQTEKKAIVTREELKAYDIEMYTLISTYYPDNVKLTGFHFDW